MFVKPAAGMLVRDPQTLQHLPEGGKEVPETAYWVRRLEAGDVVRTETPAQIQAHKIRAKKQQNDS